MSLKFLAVLLLGAASTAAAQDSYKLEKLDEAPPSELAAAVKETLETTGHRVLDAQGSPLVDIWLRKATPATAAPSGPKGAILYPVLTEGELIGAVKYVAEGYDYRDQTIEPGVFTLRYGLQPVDGDHLGVSVNRDYALLVPAAKDVDVADLPRKTLEKESPASVGTTHPGVLLLLAAPEKLPDAPTMINDQTLNTWGAILTLPLQVEGRSEPAPLPLQLTVVGAKTD
ncbi:hypothetical protein [Planctomyces sp. SH-PL62]|uniref:hypothetical protein n=1 Tax=Planctomyces sp. SH-PL62 TaxID=1636152 RepID=UPI00078D2657|nr:hypothetical protein [Planctomyces sp. SH-PL62]AMV38802.1 hypothetical protein VT85_15305 [Planctomyces sp. SH-PL62]